MAELTVREAIVLVLFEAKEKDENWLPTAEVAKRRCVRQGLPEDTDDGGTAACLRHLEEEGFILSWCNAEKGHRREWCLT